MTEARAYVATNLMPAPCGQCKKEVTAAQRWVVGHIKPRATHPELTWVPSNWRPEHRACSNKSGQAVVIAKARAEGAAAALNGVFPSEGEPGESPPLPAHIHERQNEPLEIREDLTWAYHLKNSPAWLKPYLEVPEDASPPLAMTAPHPMATGSYGEAAIGWVKDELGITLRWWQRLAFVMQLQHDKHGRLLVRTVVESGPRRVGKSVRLRSMALWRIDHADLFGEKQLALHTGKDVAIVREIHRQAWTWATERDGWAVKKGVGQEEVFLGDSRWLVRSTDSVYGYDVTLGMVDEAWAVQPSTFDEGLEPATMERLSPQSLLTSTAHRKATSLMRKKISAALAIDDGETLLLLWGAPPDADPSDPQTWRSASPHWSEDRARMLAAKYDAAAAGQVDPEIDDPDPMAGFTSQYLNVWRLNVSPLTRGNPVISEDDWSALELAPPLATPDSAAIESWFNDGVSLALGWRAGKHVVVTVSDHPDLESCVAALKESGFRGLTTVGESLMTDPALRTVRKRKGAGRTTASVQDMARLLTEDAIRHDGSEHLASQVLAVRTVPGADGPRIASKGRADAIKAAVWVTLNCRAAVSRKPRILVAKAS